MVFFTDMSIGGVSWHFDFGDGTSSNERSPSHTYANIGVYTVVQTVTGASGSDTTTRTVTIEKTPPTGIISINSGSSLTNSRNVTLTVSATNVDDGPTQMRFSNTPDDPATWENWRTYAIGPISWTLSVGDGTKIVGVQFRDSAGNISNTYKASIVLDTTPPSPCSISINAGAPSTNNTNVTLALSAMDVGSNVSQMRFSNNPTDPNSWSSWANYATSFSPWTLTAGDGQKKVGVQFKDGAGNVGPAESTIFLDSTVPGALSIVINADAPYVNWQDVMLSVSAQDFGSGVKSMRFRMYDLTQESPWSAWMDYATSKPWTLFSGDGRKWVDVQFQDSAENISSVITDTIMLDATPPADGSLTATPGDKEVALTWSGFTDALSGIKTYMLYFSSVPFTDVTKATKIYDGPALSYTHTNLDAGTIYYYRVCAMDNAGNISPGAAVNAKPKSKGRSLPFLQILLLD
jgi:PKD repeat protein